MSFAIPVWDFRDCISFPPNLSDARKHKKWITLNSKKERKSLLLSHSFYSADEFLQF